MFEKSLMAIMAILYRKKKCRKYRYLSCGEPYGNAWKCLQSSPILHMKQSWAGWAVIKLIYYLIMAMNCNFAISFVVNLIKRHENASKVVLYFIWNKVEQDEHLFNWIYYHIMAMKFLTRKGHNFSICYLIWGKPSQK